METPASQNPEAQKVQLPSRGYLYDGKMPDGWVDIRPMTTREESLLVSPKGDRYVLLNKVLDACLLTKDVPMADLVSGDRLYLLFAIRQLTYGGSYSVQLACRSCQGPVRLTLEFPKDLSLRALEPTDREPFEVQLPVSGHKVGLRLLRTKDETEILRYASRPSALSSEGDPSYIYRLARHIATIDGAVVDPTAAMALVERLAGRDSLAIRLAVEQHDCGPDLMLDTVCSRCGSQVKEMMPLTEEFFRPSS